MTYKEWMTATLARFGIEGKDVELILFNQKGLIPDVNAAADVVTAKEALCREFANIIPLANVSEGGYSLSWNWAAVKLWYGQVCDELGLIPADRPKIRSRSKVW
jgi:hypothetical protein